MHHNQNLKSRENPESLSTAVGLQLSSSATTDLDHCPHLPEEDENIWDAVKKKKLETLWHIKPEREHYYSAKINRKRGPDLEEN